MLKEWVDEVRKAAGLPATLGRAGDTEIAGYINEAQNLLAQRIVESDQAFYHVSELLSFVAGTEEYDIPRHFKDNEVILVERLKSDGSVLRKIDMIDIRHKEHYRITGVNNLQSGNVAYLRDRKIGFVPAPPGSETNAVRLWGIQMPPRMLWARVAAGAGPVATLTIPADGSSDMKAGVARTETDYYKNAIVRFVSGAGSIVGTERKVTAYNPATRVLTLESNITTTTGDEWVILPGVPEKYGYGMVQYAVARIAAKGPKPNYALKQLAQDEWETQYAAMDRNIVPRDYSTNQYIQPPVDDY